MMIGIPGGIERLKRRLRRGKRTVFGKLFEPAGSGLHGFRVRLFPPVEPEHDPALFRRRLRLGEQRRRTAQLVRLLADTSLEFDFPDRIGNTECQTVHPVVPEENENRRMSGQTGPDRSAPVGRNRSGSPECGMPAVLNVVLRNAPRKRQFRKRGFSGDGFQLKRDFQHALFRRFRLRGESPVFSPVSGNGNRTEFRVDDVAFLRRFREEHRGRCQGDCFKQKFFHYHDPLKILLYTVSPELGTPAVNVIHSFLQQSDMTVCKCMIGSYPGMTERYMRPTRIG